MSMTPDGAHSFAATFNELVANVGKAVLGKEHVARLSFMTMLAGGHLLLEDAPGTGKTSLARAVAASVSGTHSRIQFTPDLLPSDVTGVSVYQQSTGAFEFHRGPVFAAVVLADEINRASPKTQSALLEVMEEGHVTVDGVSHTAGRPFMVIATQNPIEQAGTYRLPEAQLDRFLAKTSIGYPDSEAAIDILAGSALRDRASTLTPVVTSSQIVAMAEAAAEVYVERSVLGYVNALVEGTRTDPRTQLGASVRGALSLVRAAKVWAAAAGRHYVIPDDVKALAVPVLAHRLVLDPDAEFSGTKAPDVVSDVVAAVAPPVARGA